MADVLVERLAAVLGAAEITGLTQLSGGASRNTWRFEADGQPLILQCQREGDERDMAVEIAAVRAAAACGVPTATVVRATTDPTEIGVAYMIMTRISGETTARKILRDEQFAGARQVLPAQLADALVRIHAIDPAQVPGIASVDQVQHYREMLDTLGHPHPTFELAFRWLDDHRPAPAESVVVHGDFRLGNVVVDDVGLRAVLDWEFVHLGDPMEDLGWLCVKAWRFGSPKPVAGIGRVRATVRALRGSGGSPRRPSGRPVVGSARNVEVGDHVHHAGQRPPHRRDPQS